MIAPSLLNIVDKNTYLLWVDMLKLLGLNGRTQRISVFVAGMLQYAYELYLKNLDSDEQNKLGELMIAAFETGHDEAQEWLSPVLQELFRDAGLRWEKTNSKGQKYSVIAASIDEFYRWHDMPWEY